MVTDDKDRKSSLSESDLQTGSLEVVGRLVDASNATIFAKISIGETQYSVVYKPIAGERPLWDFTDGNLASREVAAYTISRELNFNLVPTTVLREGPFGLGAVQEWIEIDEEIDVIAEAQKDNPQLRQLALLDILINNTDRKFGHLLFNKSGRLYGCDHGVTFHVQPKLRTVLWQFSGMSLNRNEVELLEKSVTNFAALEDSLRPLITKAEVLALKKRFENLLSEGSFPYPSDEWPAVPWPPF